MKKMLLCISAMMLLLLFACSNNDNSTGPGSNEDVILDISNNFIAEITDGDLSGAEQYVTSDFIWITDYASLYVPGDGDTGALNDLLEYWVEDVQSIEQVSLSSDIEINNNEASVQFTVNMWKVTTENWIKLRKDDNWKIYQFICDL